MNQPAACMLALDMQKPYLLLEQYSCRQMGDGNGTKVALGKS